LRYEVGEHSNFIAVPMMRAAVQQINQWKPANIQAYCEKISKKSLAQLIDAGFWIEESNYRAQHLFGIRLPKNVNREKVVEALQKNKIAVSFRGDAIRVSPHVYNLEAEMNKLASVLKKV
jgi:selenocysteine lyase/cysteine desulfurase